MSLEVIPTSIERTEQGGIRIRWSDLTDVEWSPVELRKACPCATCREKRRSEDTEKPRALLPVLSMAEAQPLTVQRMRPVGNYAYNIQFSDGHDSGIFSFDLIRSLAI